MKYLLILLLSLGCLGCFKTVPKELVIYSKTLESDLRRHLEDDQKTYELLGNEILEQEYEVVEKEAESNFLKLYNKLNQGEFDVELMREEIKKYAVAYEAMRTRAKQHVSTLMTVVAKSPTLDRAIESSANITKYLTELNTTDWNTLFKEIESVAPLVEDILATRAEEKIKRKEARAARDQAALEEMKSLLQEQE